MSPSGGPLVPPGQPGGPPASPQPISIPTSPVQPGETILPYEPTSYPESAMQPTNVLQGKEAGLTMEQVEKALGAAGTVAGTASSLTQEPPGEPRNQVVQRQSATRPGGGGGLGGMQAQSPAQLTSILRALLFGSGPKQMPGAMGRAPFT